MGHEHEKMLLDLPGIKLIGFADIDPKQLEDVTEGLKRYASNEELMADPEVDVVLIAANNKFHKDLVIQAANAKKDIICEKPIAMSLEELDEMEAAVKKNGVKFTVHHQRRFDPDFRTAKAVYDSGTLGDIYCVKSMLYGFNGNIHDWHVFVSEGGGMISHRHMTVIENLNKRGHNLKVVAAAEIDKEKLLAWGKQYGIQSNVS